MNTFTPNTLIVSMLVWLAGVVMKKIPAIKNDMIPQLTYYVSVATAYLLAILHGMAASHPATTMLGSHLYFATDPPLLPAGPPIEPAGEGTVAWVIVNAWDWIGRKLIFGALKKLIKKVRL